MSFVLECLIAVAIIAILWWYINVTSIRNKLSWVFKIPGVPLLGNGLQFVGSNTEHFNTMFKLLKMSNEIKSVRLDFIHKTAILTADPKLIEFTLSSNSLKILNKGEVYRFITPWLGTGLLTSDGKKWKPRRKIITPTFHFKILEQFVDVFESKGKIFIDELSKETKNNGFDVYPYVTMCTLDIICESAMGVSINAQKQKHSDYVTSVKNMCRIVVERSFSPFQMFDALFYFTNNYKTQKESLSILHTYTNNVIKQKRKELEASDKKFIDIEDDFGVKKKMAFLDWLLQTTIDNKPLSDKDIREEVDTFMFEGHDTTASAISFAMYLLANNPKEQAKVYEEAKSMFGDDKEKSATFKDLQEMKYLENVIKETLRLYPSVPIYSRCLTDDIEYQEGKIIPKGTQLGIFAFGVGRDKDYYKDPEKFMPSRFDSMDGKTPFSYIPFSAGPRNCIGQKFAMLEMKSTLSKLIRNYELLPSVPEHKLILVPETVLKSKNGIKIRIQNRK
ncbi:unnamed protein product [Brassicogethes aeneus]|uniref:Cytochrome P450 n=1 Tax=Brassicogethes aeneus TaxID=1431903 RepID=A0A9P0B8L1_BRAAE|nr:unnamed protein product [Brassicogethes aeneus]